MGIDLIFRIAAVGILVSILNQVLSKSGKEDITMITTIAGVIIVLMMVIPEIVKFFDTVKAMFQF